MRVNDAAPFVTRKFPGSISPHGKKAEPVVVRQFERWQMNAATNSSETSYSTVWQPQRPFSTPRV
jgi:hypothetical protein